MEDGKRDASGGALTWSLASAATTLAAAVVAYAAFRPTSCAEVAGCAEVYRQLPSTFSGHAACGLCTVLIHEVAALWLNFNSAKPIRGMIEGIEDVFIPPLLLCVTFTVLVIENAIFLLDSSVALAHASSSSHRPVFTVIYLEWLINVPLLIVLVGKCALGRKMREVMGQVIATNLYIVVAWCAGFSTSSWLKLGLVGFSFTMYGWCSVKMVSWVREHHREAEASTRVSVSIGLVVAFGVYGIVYVTALAGVIDSSVEKSLYLCMNVGVKLVMSMAFAGIRSSEYHGMLVQTFLSTSKPFQRSVDPLARRPEQPMVAF